MADRPAAIDRPSGDPKPRHSASILIRPVPTGAAVRAGSQARRTRAHGRGPDAQRVGDPVATRLTCWYRAGSPPPPAIAEREVSSAPAPRPFAVRNGGIHDVDDLASCVP